MIIHEGRVLEYSINCERIVVEDAHFMTNCDYTLLIRKCHNIIFGKGTMADAVVFLCFRQINST